MRKHTDSELNRTAELVWLELVDLLHRLGQSNVEARSNANAILHYNFGRLKHLLNMPHGGSLSPEELAEMLLSHHIQNRQSGEEAAAVHLT